MSIQRHTNTRVRNTHALHPFEMAGRSAMASRTVTALRFAHTCTNRHTLHTDRDTHTHFLHIYSRVASV